MGYSCRSLAVVGILSIFILTHGVSFAVDDVGAPDANERPLANTGEETSPADKVTKDIPMQPRESDTFFKLSNARVERGPKPWPVLIVDYERVHDGNHFGQTLVIQDTKGHQRQYILIGPFADRKGEIKIDMHIGGPRDPGTPKDAELYLTRQDLRFAWHPTFKVSDSAVLGTMKETTKARTWTEDETAKLRAGPPDYSNPNAHPNVGSDTPFAGRDSGGVTSRFVSPNHPLLGVEYRTSAWDNEKCLAQLVPVYSEDQPKSIEPRVIAKDGYAVGGMNVKSAKFVDAVQLIFMRLKADGSLDQTDRYTSDWLGEAAPTVKTTKLAGTGRRVLGIHCRNGAILDGVALVLDKQKKVLDSQNNR